MFEQVQLETNEGVFVHEGTMPKFNLRPTVILWGIRVFVYFGLADEGTDKEVAVYRESFAYYLTERPEDKVKQEK